MAIRMIAADMDGTLLDDNKKISLRTIQAVAKAMEMGALFVLNSGRMPQSIIPFAQQLQVNAPVICFNGALTYDTAKGAAQAGIPLKMEPARAILRRAEEMGLYAQAFWGDKFYVDRYTEKTRFYEDKAQVKGVALNKPLSQAVNSDVYKLLLILEPGQMKAVLPAFAEAFEGVASCAASSPTFLEIVDASANKGAALRALGARWGVAPSEILAFGDELNDLSMLTTVGYGYAMANAVEAVRRQVRLVAPANTQDGLAQVLEKCAREGMFAPPREGRQ